MSKVFWFFLIFSFLSGCQKEKAPPSPVETPPSVVTPSPVAPPPIKNPDPVNAGNIDEIVKKSTCASYQWKQRGKAPIGYVKGVARSYAKSYCEMNTETVKAITQAPGNSDKDALAHYGISASDSKKRLNQVYTFILGLGMRESSGNYGEGRDKTVPNQTSVEAETGAWQFSANSLNASPLLKKIYSYYQSNPELCDLKIFAEGAKAPNAEYIGSGPGFEFQRFMRNCPAAQAQYTALGIRVLRKHWGPINRKEVEYNTSCERMFSEIEKALKCP